MLMWLGLFLALALILAAVVTVLGGGIFTIILVPLFAVAVVVVVAVAGLGHRAGDDTPNMFSSAPEPTGRPRSGSAGAGTANERVGQR
jgi:hypothetical protein